MWIQYCTAVHGCMTYCTSDIFTLLVNKLFKQEKNLNKLCTMLNIYYTSMEYYLV